VIRKILARLTYANILATVAVVLAMGGTAAAAFIINSNADVAPGTISGHNPPGGDHANIIGQSVTTGDLATSAVNGPKVADSAISSGKIADGSIQPTDLSAAALGARAYGYVPTSLDATRSKNVLAVSNPSPGTYCVKLVASIDPSTATLIAATEYGSDSTSYIADNEAHAEWWQGAPDCTTRRLEVRTFLDEQKTQVQSVDGCAGCTVDDTYRDLDLVNQGFSFVVP
jgi:hypothetical protein